jgi:UDP-3-O-[3-hydroxymyristoyl] glucosamine N-acyltransferase
MERSLQEIAEFVQAQIAGDSAVRIKRVASIQSARPSDLVFAQNEKDLRAALDSAASAVITGEFGIGKADSKTLLISQHPKLAFARAARFIHLPTKHVAEIHPSALVHRTAKLGEAVTVEAHAVIGENARIGPRSRIGAGTVVGADVSIGADCEIYPRVTIYSGSSIGNRVTVHAGAVLGSDGFGYVHDAATGRYEKFPQVGRLEIEDDVEIGANSTIDRGALEVTRIARGTKIDNLVHIGHNCRIGEDVIIAAQTGLSGSIVIEKNVVLGGQVGIGEHARIEEGVMLGGQGGVLPNKILRGKGEVFWGTPAHPLREYLRQLAALTRLARKNK